MELASGDFDLDSLAHGRARHHAEKRLPHVVNVWVPCQKWVSDTRFRNI